MFTSADAYDRFMGRFSKLLAPRFADFAEVGPGQRALDVGCGPGALTGELVLRLGADSVAALDPSEPFVDAIKARFPNIDVRIASAEEIPHPDRGFDTVLAQLVVHFMKDPVKGLAEMRRVTRPGGLVAACVWDHAGGQGPLAHFWAAVGDFDPGAFDESALPGTREGHLAELLGDAGLTGIDAEALWVEVQHDTFDKWWQPFTLGVGPAGAYVAGLSDTRRDALRDTCRRLLPDAPFRTSAKAWAARGRASMT